jgi:hypothetical protein
VDEKVSLAGIITGYWSAGVVEYWENTAFASLHHFITPTRHDLACFATRPVALK